MIVLVSILIALFGMGSWVAINGVWAELPILVSELPESWNLPTYLVLIIQAANVGPILFSVMRQCKKDFTSLKYTAYAILLLGFLASILLSQFWDREVNVGSKQSSLALLFLAFVFALLDCTSSVVFLPFMAKYPSSYMVPFYIGEGMSGVMPSVLALAQGAGGDTCSNSSSTDEPSGPRFGVGLYFGLLSILMAVSGIAFYFLNHLGVSLSARYNHINGRISPESGDSPNEPAQDPQETKNNNIKVHEVFFSKSGEHAQTRLVLIQLYLVIGIVSALGNGVIPAILSYACLPYGPTAYHLATELALLANPLCCFLAFFVACRRPPVLGALCAFSVVVASLIIHTATLSPSPWLVGTTQGTFLIILLNVLWTGCISYTKVNVASILQGYGENALMFCGIITQLGSCIGAICIFIISMRTSSFKAC